MIQEYSDLPDLTALEEAHLAPYAARSSQSRGRQRPEPAAWRAPNSSVTVTGLFIALRSDGWNTKRRFLSIMKAICSGPGSRIAWKWRKLRVRSRAICA